MPAEALASDVGGSSASSSVASNMGSAAVSSGLDTGGGIMATYLANLESNAFASTARNWEVSMSDTAHQREVQDLKKAGLNPVLSGMGGSGASTPNVAAAPVQKADFSPAAKFWNTMQQQSSINSANANALQSKASAANLTEQVNTEKTKQLANSASAARDLSQKDLNDLNQLLVHSNVRGKEIENDYNAAQYSVYKNPTVGRILPWLDYIDSFIPFSKWFGPKSSPTYNFNR